MRDRTKDDDAALKAEGIALMRDRSFREAAAIFEELHRSRPDNIDFHARLAAAHRALGNLERADALYTEVLARSPDRKGSLVARIAIATARGDMRQALERCDEALVQLPDDPGIVRRRADLLQKLDRPDDAIAALQSLLDLDPANLSAAAALAALHWNRGDAAESGRYLEIIGSALATSGSALTDAELVRLSTIAQRSEAFDVMTAIIDCLVARNTLARSAANLLMQTAYQVGGTALAQSVSQAIESRIAESDLLHFRFATEKLLHGPTAAIRAIRQITGSKRNPAEARLLAEALIEAGCNRLAFRYLRCCRRAWPDDVAIGRLLVRACILNGREDTALSVIDELEDLTGGDLRLVRFNVLLEEGRLEDADTLAEGLAQDDGPQPEPSQMVRLMLALGRLDDARAHVPNLLSSQKSSVSSAAHFGTTLVGQMINEMRIQVHSTAGERAEDGGDFDNYFYPAKTIVEQWVAAAPPSPPPSVTAPRTIPRRVMQYWDKEEPPAEVTALMRSWRDAPGYEYRRFDRNSARAFLRDEYGKDYAQAFRLANNIAEQCDFLRLCLLHRLGGVYADADDRLTGSLDALSASVTGLALFVEPLGAISNNVICAAPGHPVIGLAMERALASILARENDSTWAKTGPGLMTRVAARHIVDARNKGEPVQICLRKRSDLRRHVHPHVKLSYKSGAAYWNANNDKVSSGVRETLRELAGQTT